MRNCPACRERTVSNLKLALQDYIPGVVAACAKCHAMVDFKNHDGLFSVVLTKWILLGLLLISLVYFGMLWVGVAVFVFWRLLRLYSRLNGPLINVHPTS